LSRRTSKGRPQRLAELHVLRELVRERRATTPELSRVLQRTDAKTRNLVARMVERGWIQARGDGEGRGWHLSAAVYGFLTAPVGYVRVHGFEPLQQEQMVLQYVDAHRHITRTEAADLCSLTPDQASRLLRRLAKEGRLELPESADDGQERLQDILVHVRHLDGRCPGVQPAADHRGVLRGRRPVPAERVTVSLTGREGR
jgi:DNA-binding MarR family transcriptional regulator